ncbi:MAG: hypothetical protein P8X68_23135, partial [Desulfobacterales bacterium]
VFYRRLKNNASTIGWVCVFDAKIYKNVGGDFDVSSCVVWNKKILKIPIFVFNYHRFWSKNWLNFTYLNTQNIKNETQITQISKGKRTNRKS